MVGEEEADFYMAEHADYDKETFVATAWPLMKHVIKGVAAKPNRITKKRKVVYSRRLIRLEVSSKLEFLENSWILKEDWQI